MDCKITFRRFNSLWCRTHQVEGMSAICAVAEQALRDRITELETALQRALQDRETAHAALLAAGVTAVLEVVQ